MKVRVLYAVTVDRIAEFDVDVDDPSFKEWSSHYEVTGELIKDWLTSETEDWTPPANAVVTEDIDEDVNIDIVTLLG